ncbi:MAG TPA: dephospho-CoA kinase [Jatrophihabitantaceae bacterium]
MRVGLTGGLGSGKSTVAAMLAQHGAVIIDADAIAFEVVRAGTSGFDAVVARFGPDVVGADGELARARLAEIVFADDAARDALNEIVHPLVAQRSAQLMAGVADDAIVVYDVPLLAENDLAGGFDVVVIVEADLATRLRRLAARGLPEPMARARIAVQASDEQRRAIADVILHNDGSQEALAAQVDALWGQLAARTR